MTFKSLPASLPDHEGPQNTRHCGPTMAWLAAYARLAAVVRCGWPRNAPPNHLQALQERERTRHAAIQAATVQDSGIATRSFESLRPWIERTSWEQTYDGLHRDLLRRLTEMPLLYDSCQAHRLWSSPGEADLTFASDCSVSSSLGPEPLHPRSRRSQQWDDHVDSMSGSDAAGESSKDDLDEEWDQPDDTESDSEDVTTDDLDNEAREGAGAAESTNYLNEFTDRQPLSSLLVYFSRILGFSPDAQSFQPAKSFTPHLSTLIYIQQLLFLEYALPYCDYPMIGWNRRPRRYHLDHLNPIRSRYMIAGALTPLAEF
uniref:Putative glucuronosyltransferase sqv-8 n=1 Tax=Talaromyces marneffei PM1 TaxID=1077442 RepID=A0A093USS0_TALMA